MQKLSSFIRKINVKNTQRFFSTRAEVEQSLKNKLQMEIKEEAERNLEDKESTIHLENYSYLKTHGWKLQRSAESTQMKLQKQLGEKKITVAYNARLPVASFQEEQIKDSQGEQDNIQIQEQNIVDMIVSIDNGKGQQLVCNIIGVDHELNINSVFVTSKGEDYLNNKNLLFGANEYLGPQFDSLDDELSGDIQYLLEKYGIDKELLDFVEESQIEQDQVLYVNWLKKLNSFL